MEDGKLIYMSSPHIQTAPQLPSVQDCSRCLKGHFPLLRGWSIAETVCEAQGALDNFCKSKLLVCRDIYLKLIHFFGFKKKKKREL